MNYVDFHKIEEYCNANFFLSRFLYRKWTWYTTYAVFVVFFLMILVLKYKFCPNSFHSCGFRPCGFVVVVFFVAFFVVDGFRPICCRCLN